MIRRRVVFSITLLLGGLISPVAAEAQRAANIARIGYLAGDLAGSPQLPEAFRQGLRDLGYVVGRNLVIETRDAEGKRDRLPALAVELIALKVDVILAASTLEALAAKQATRTLPIVFATSGDPVTSGIVASLARPGGNITGLSGPSDIRRNLHTELRLHDCASRVEPERARLLPSEGLPTMWPGRF